MRVLGRIVLVLTTAAASSVAYSQSSRPRDKTAVVAYQFAGQTLTQTIYFSPTGRVFFPTSTSGGGIGGGEAVPGKTISHAVKISTPKGPAECNLLTRASWVDLTLLINSTMECTSAVPNMNGLLHVLRPHLSFH